MPFSPGWLDSLVERSGLTTLARELRAFARRDRGTGMDEPLDSKPEVRSETPQSSPTEPTMPKKPQARSKKTSQARSPSAKSPRATKTARPAPRKAAARSGSKPSTARGAGRASTSTANALNVLVEALKAHPQQKNLVSAGQQKDQLLRSLIPLYLARSLDVEVTSGTTSRFWNKLGVTYAAPNAAKALRTHTGYASETKKGRAITARGVKYVEQALART